MKTTHKCEIWFGTTEGAQAGEGLWSISSIRWMVKPPLWGSVWMPWAGGDVHLLPQDPFSHWTPFPGKAVAHPHSVQLLGLRIQAVADVQQVEDGLVPYAIQQPFGEIADIVPPEVPHPEDAGRDARLRVRVAAVTEILAQVFAVPEPLHKFCRTHGRMSTDHLTLETHPCLSPPPIPSQGQDSARCFHDAEAVLGKLWQTPEALSHGHAWALLLCNRCWEIEPSRNTLGFGRWAF